MIDIHTHLLPGVDDGSPSIDASRPVLERFRRDGVEVVVCTPHLDASRAAHAPYDRHIEILAGLRAAVPHSPELRLGWEIMLDVPGADLRAPHFALGGSKAVLVEFPRHQVPMNAGEELFRLRMSGVVPVLAHPERYWGCTPRQVAEWRRMGAVIQMDAAGLLGRNEMARLSLDLLELGLVDLLASDNHGDSRSLRTTRRWLRDLGAGDQAELLTRTNAARLLTDEPLLPVPPVERQKGMVERLRELLLGRRRAG
jgi:protein-tyrosine phosphatase